MNEQTLNQHAKTAEDAIHKLRSLDADPKRGMVIEVTPDLVDVIRRA
jgi:hypothetical protein